MMEIHRKPVRMATPAELLMFSEDEWAAPDDEASWRAFERWKDARRSYCKAHLRLPQNRGGIGYKE